MKEDCNKNITNIIKNISCCILVIFLYAFFASCFNTLGTALNIDSNIAQIACGIIFSFLAFFVFLVPIKQMQIKNGIISGNESKKIPVLWIAVFGIFCCLLLNCLVYYGSLDALYKTYESFADRLYSGKMIAVAIRMAITAPIVEEIIYRGVIYNAIKSIGGKIAGIILSSLIFGVMHGNLLQGVYAFTLGVILSLLYEKYDSLAPCFIFHICANYISFFGTMTNVIDFVFYSKYTMLYYIIMSAAIVVVIGVKLITMSDDIEKNIYNKMKK